MVQSHPSLPDRARRSVDLSGLQNRPARLDSSVPCQNNGKGITETPRRTAPDERNTRGVCEQKTYDSPWSNGLGRRALIPEIGVRLLGG